MDPNWFYSSLAQCAAAIVGLMGGIFIARLQDQLNLIRARKTQLLHDYVEFRRNLKDIQESIIPYCQELKNRSTQLSNALQAAATELEFTSYLSVGPLILNSENVEVSEQNLRRLERDIDDLHRFVRCTEPLLDWNALDVERIEESIKHVSIHRASCDTVRNLADGQIAVLETLKKEVAMHSSALLPPSTYVMLSVLAWFSVVGVFVPLRYAWGGDLKNTLSGLFAVGLLGLFGYFAMLLGEIRAAGRLNVPERDKVATEVAQG